MTVVLNEQPAPSDLRREVRTANNASLRRRWPEMLLLAMLVAGVMALAVSSYYDRRSFGEKIDATVQGLRDGANAAAEGGALASDRAAVALADTGITVAVKTALATEPVLSMLKIEVKTEGGMVSLAGPAPDERARERAAVLAAAPAGVVRVDNRLVVSPPAAPPPR